MKIPGSIRALYDSEIDNYCQLKEVVDTIFINKKQRRWHYESRIKEIHSFALKVESGRGFRGETLEDLFACTLVVENNAALAVAETLVSDSMVIEERRPSSGADTHIRPESFPFQDLRLYAKCRAADVDRLRAFENCTFEIQVKTFLQHAWAIATHDLVYKGADRSWGRSRIAYQVKAMLEQAETAIAAASLDSVGAMVDKPYRQYRDIADVVLKLEERWSKDSLPEDRATLAVNLMSLMRALKIDLPDFFQLVDDATNSGRGASTENLSPFAACLQSAIDREEGKVLAYLQGKKKEKDFVILLPRELELPSRWQGRDMPRARHVS